MSAYCLFASLSHDTVPLKERRQKGDEVLWGIDDSKHRKLYTHKFVLEHIRQKKINVLFPETSKYFYGSVGRQKIFCRNNFLYRKSIKLAY